MTAGKKPQVLFLWLFLAAAAGLAFTQSAYFVVREVQVEGLVRLTRAEVLSVGGIDLPANLFELDARAIEARLAEYPAVAQVKVRRRLPAQFRIELTERRPVGAIPYGEHLLLFDGAGVPFAVRRRADVQALPVVTGIRPSPVRLGKAARGEDLRWVAAVLQAVPAPIREQLSGVQAGQGLALTLVLKNGVQVRLGGREAMERKLGLVQSILAEADGNQWPVREIDVRNPEQPFLRKGEAVPDGIGEGGRR